MTEPSLTRRAVGLGLVLVAAASLGFASRFLHDPLMADEVYLVIAADHLAREGRPMTRTKADAARFAAIARASGPSADERDTGYALWHPPLYIHLVAVVFGLAGTGAAQARLVGLGCLLATILATYVLSQAVDIRGPSILIPLRIVQFPALYSAVATFRWMQSASGNVWNYNLLSSKSMIIMFGSP